MKIIEAKTLSSINDFTNKEFIDLMINFSRAHSGSSELFFKFEMRAAREINLIDPIDIAPMLSSFADSGHCREKLFVHYIHKIKSMFLR